VGCRGCSPPWITLTTLGTTSMQVAAQAPPHFLWSAGSHPTCFRCLIPLFNCLKQCGRQPMVSDTALLVGPTLISSAAYPPTNRTRKASQLAYSALFIGPILISSTAYPPSNRTRQASQLAYSALFIGPILIWVKNTAQTARLCGPSQGHSARKTFPLLSSHLLFCQVYSIPPVVTLKQPSGNH